MAPGMKQHRALSVAILPATKQGIRIMSEQTIDLSALGLSKLANLIRRDWGTKVNYAAKPYLDAMAQLETIRDKYYQDDARGIVSYFLANAGTWRGENAKLIKAELKRRVGTR